MTTLTSEPGAVSAKSEFSSVAVIGLGYIGLPTAAVLAHSGIDVVGVDISEKTVEAVNRGEVPFVEPELGTHVAAAVSQGKLKAQLSVSAASVYIIAVPTPFLEDKSADLSFIMAAAENIAPVLVGGELVILESTSPPGTTQRLADHILEIRPDLSLDGSDNRPVVYFAHCPERVLPGKVMTEIVTNDRVVGEVNPGAAAMASSLYRTFCKGKMLETDAATAELSKLVENTYRDVNIALANELSIVSKNLGVDVWELIEIANHHPRVNILQPGPGVGGHCIAVDPWFIVAADKENTPLIRTAREVNDAKPGHVVKQIMAPFKVSDKPIIAALGLAFKSNIDDMRESPSVSIVRKLALENTGIKILVVEPHTDELPQQLDGLSNVQLVTAAEAIDQADAVVLLVDHDKFREIDIDRLSKKHVVDTRGFWSK
ncbi:UDP-N-acetyl-D-mannosamine dehydrogenase [Arthrobacter psychrolactophilus]|uniref:UDP-N-acetyl-D-mannosamine dehydrogenase n=1 Tax=Arthrobacter psychrolactophilus TaxID=92442 RepID=A0A2V5JNH6_9MICC|nr:UDP-N-acetyl-D-mannosamine dehydrogenase [Arthrobacter psychrolactophilus]PYI39916.1 UDP-N-acetyl-D-mannosamine dehydrogenase [Arthrobacter psychrolactophilus]